MTKFRVLLCKINKKDSLVLLYVYIEPKMAFFSKKAFFGYTAQKKNSENPLF